MNFDPQKFFIGLMDFFSILLPGALLTHRLMDEVGSAVLGELRFRSLSGAEAWAAFLFTMGPLTSAETIKRILGAPGDSAALQRERDQRTYGDATRELVCAFQQERQLEDRGEVDKPTANALTDGRRIIVLAKYFAQC